MADPVSAEPTPQELIIEAGADALRRAARAMEDGYYRRGQALLVFPEDDVCPLEVGGTPQRLAWIIAPAVLRAAAVRMRVECRHALDVYCQSRADDLDRYATEVEAVGRAVLEEHR